LGNLKKREGGGLYVKLLLLFLSSYIGINLNVYCFEPLEPRLKSFKG
jgi:hypothetical protein